MRNTNFFLTTCIVFLGALTACDNTPTIEQLLSDPDLRHKTFEICQKNNVTAFAKDNKHFKLCEIWRSADSLCSTSNSSCKSK